MNSETAKRYSLTEIGLLAFFIVSLIAAQMIVSARQRVILSEPIPLDGSGLSVCKPVSTGWESTEHWQYESNNRFTLVAQQFRETSREVEIRWRYQLGRSGQSAQEMLRQYAKKVHGTLGTIESKTGPVAMEYAAIHLADGSGRTFFMGIANLDFGRSVELQVLPRRSNLFYAENLFDLLASNIQYTPQLALQHGQDVADALWQSPESITSAAGRTPETFIIRTAQQEPVGYSHSEFSEASHESDAAITINSRYYELNHSLINSTLKLHGTDDSFQWTSVIHRIGLGQPRTYSLDRNAEGILKVDLDFDTSQNHQFPSGNLLIPELLLPQTAAIFLEQIENGTLQTSDEIIVDVLASTGFVVPTILSKGDPDKAAARSDKTVAVVKVNFLNHAQSQEELYFNQQGQFFARFEQQQRRLRLWELTSPDQLPQIFKENLHSKPETVALTSQIR